MRNFIHLLGDYKLPFLFVTLYSALVTGTEAVLHPILMKAIFDAVENRVGLANFLRIGLYYFALGIVINVLNYYASVLQMKSDNKIIANVSNHLLVSYFSKSYNEVLKSGPGYYVARIRSDVKDGLAPMLITSRKIIISVTTFILLICTLIYISPRAFVILAAIIPVSTAVSVFVSRKIRKLTGTERETEAALVNVLTKSVQAFKIVSGFGLTSMTTGIFSKSLDSALDASFQKANSVRRLQVASDLTMVISDVCSIFVGAALVFQSRMTLGSFIGFMNAFWRSATTLISIFSQWANLHGYSATIDRLIDFAESGQVIRNAQTRGQTVCAQGLSYSYGTEDILSELTISIMEGERVLIVGENGAGKTTLANILSGNLEPSGGRLELPTRISAVTLPLHFPPVPVRNLPIDFELLERLGLNDQTLLDAEPDELSAGQQQKVALAMALTKEADLYVLDEPLANLDTVSRMRAMREIQARVKGKMLAMIMHDADEHAHNFDKSYKIKRALKDTKFEVADARLVST